MHVSISLNNYMSYVDDNLPPQFSSKILTTYGTDLTPLVFVSGAEEVNDRKTGGSVCWGVIFS